MLFEEVFAERPFPMMQRREEKLLALEHRKSGFHSASRKIRHLEQEVAIVQLQRCDQGYTLSKLNVTNRDSVGTLNAASLWA